MKINDGVRGGGIQSKDESKVPVSGKAFGEILDGEAGEDPEVVEQVEEREAMLEEEEKLRDERREVDKWEGWKGDRVKKELRREKVIESEKVEGVDGDFQKMGSQVQVKEAAPVKEVPASRQVEQEIVQALHVGQDKQARKVVLVDVNIPGKGNVRIRLRRQGDQVEVRMRTENEELARELRAGRGELREEGKKRGVNFSTIEVV